MKTVKIALPVLGFLFAIVASLASNNHKKLPAPNFIQLTTDYCAQITWVCNEMGVHMCKFQGDGGPYYVFDEKTSTTTCSNQIRHSLNGGIVNP